MSGTPFPAKPSLWTAAPGLIRPEYQFQWRNPVILLPMLEPWPRISSGFGTGTDLVFDLASRVHWHSEDSLVFPDRDELGFSVRIGDDSRNLLRPNVLDVLDDIPANTPFTMALMLKPAATGTAQMLRDGNNFFILDDRASSPGSGEYGTWTRLAGSDIFDEEDGDQNIVYKEQWNSVVFTWDGTTARSFINGAFAVSGAASSVDKWDLNRFGEGFSGQGYVGNLGYFSVHRNAWSAEDAVLFHQDPWGGFRMADDVPHVMSTEIVADAVTNTRSARIVSVIST